LISPTRIGYEFIGWYDNQGKHLSNNYQINQDIEIYAHFNLIKYRLIWDMGGKSAKILSDHKTEFTVLDWEDETFTNGVVPTIDSKTIEFSNWDKIAIPCGTTEPFVFTAQWKTKQYAVSWMSDNRVVKKSWHEYNHEIEESDFPQDLTLEGHDFLGWKDGSNDVYFPYVVDKDTIFTAQWKINTYEVVFNYKGSGGQYIQETRTCGWNEKLDFPDLPAIDGYEFIGWYVGSDIEEHVDDVDFHVTKNCELWERYVGGGHVVRIDANGGAFNIISLPFSGNQRLYSSSPIPHMKGD
jgi:uncharacterized repeat protein (TIGR02543 family)